MSNVIDFEENRPPVTRPIEMPDGSLWEVTLPAGGFECLDFVLAVEDVTAGELGVYALEEMELQPLTFDEAFYVVVAHLAERWVA